MYEFQPQMSLKIFNISYLVLLAPAILNFKHAPWYADSAKFVTSVCLYCPDGHIIV